MSQRTYSFDAALRIWQTPSHYSIAYSDGNDVELRLLGILKHCHDLSSTSEELRQHIVDWPSEYHFSAVRHNLLRPLALGPGTRVLELGCGCGAMTRYLGECGANVVAVEGSLQRAAIAAERCRDLDGVSVYCDNLSDFHSNERFDVVTLIGVLEYAQLFVKDSDPIAACLRIARSFLSERGRLVIAIENQVGLKYLNGCPEDHLGAPYFGLHDLYTQRTAITFGRRELEARFRSAGLAHWRFLYPFPDYKLPNLIVSDEGTRNPDFDIASLLYRTISRNSGNIARRNFHEGLAWRALVRNGMLDDLANSFLVIAQTSAAPIPATGWLGAVYSTDRLPPFATETCFELEKQAILVRKHRLYPLHAEIPLVSALPAWHQLQEQVPYVRGRLYAATVHPVMARGGNIADLAAWAAPWIACLYSAALPGGLPTLLPAEWLDAVPSNFIIGDDGKLVAIDAEWGAPGPVPLAWVLARGFASLLSTCPACSGLDGMSYREVIDEVLERSGRTPFTDADFQDAAAREDALGAAIYGAQRGTGSFALFLDRPVAASLATPTIAEENEAMRTQLAAILGSRSWRITRVLRWGDGVLQTLRHKSAIGQ